MRFVFDTNTIVSALLLPDSKPRLALDRAQERGKILVSLSALLELNEVIARKKFDKYVSEEKRKEFLAALVKQAELLEVTGRSGIAVTRKTTNSWSSRLVAKPIAS